MDWKFIDPPDHAVIVDKAIISGDGWISLVTHDEDDGIWQFHTNEQGPKKEDDALVVSLREILNIDASITSLADLPLGWRAWRGSVYEQWQRAEAGKV